MHCYQGLSLLLIEWQYMPRHVRAIDGIAGYIMLGGGIKTMPKGIIEPVNVSDFIVFNQTH